MAWPTEANRMPTNATTGELIPEMYSTKVIDHVKSNLVAVSVCDTSWRAQLAKGDKVHIPIMTTISTADVDPHSSFLDVADAKAFTTAPTYIEITKWKENPIMIDDSTAAQTHVTNVFEMAAKNAAYGLEAAIDTDVNSLFDDCTATWAGSDGQTFTDDLFIELQEGLDEADVSRADRALVGDPSMAADIYKIDKFMSFDYSRKPYMDNGYIGHLPAYNVPVHISNNLLAVSSGTGAYGILLHREAIGVVLQSAMKVERWREPTRHADALNISCFYGFRVLRATFGAEFYTRKA